jgi:hypothetical protein
MTELASYAADTVKLGENSTSATIELCGGKGQISYYALSSTTGQIYLTGPNGAVLQSTSGPANGSDTGIGYTEIGGVSTIGMEADTYIVAGVSLSRAQMETALQPVVLFDGYTLDNITLPELAVNFSDIRIYYNVNGQCLGSVDVHNPNGKPCVQMHGMFQATDTIAQYRFRAVSIQDKEIKTQSSGYVNFETSGRFGLQFGDNKVFITRIVGWRKT